MTHAVGAGRLTDNRRRVSVDALGAEAAPHDLEGDARENRRARYAELIAIAQAEMDRLHEQIRGSGYAVLLTDATGAVLYEKCDANVPSTALERMGPGVPVRGVGQEVIAVLDAACVGSAATRASHLHMMALINVSAHIIEKCLFLRHHQHHAVLRFHSRAELVDLLHDGALALAPDGTVIGADRAAEKLLGADDRYQLVGRPVSDLNAQRSGRCAKCAAGSASTRASMADRTCAQALRQASAARVPPSCRWPPVRARMRSRSKSLGAMIRRCCAMSEARTASPIRVSPC
jgi:transcriptional regulator of acetoin/glycerol metabolism